MTAMQDEQTTREPQRRISRRRWLSLAAGTLLLATGVVTGLVQVLPASAHDQDPLDRLSWSGTWGSAQVLPLGPPTFPVLDNQTIRQTARISLGGEFVRVRLSNENGPSAIALGAARVALADTGGNIRPGTDRALTFSGKASIVLRAGAPVVSDPVRLRARDLETLSVSLFLPGRVTPISGHLTAIATTYLAATGSGDTTAAVRFPTASTRTSSFLLAGIEVVAPDARGVIVALGDSITDGALSTDDANRRWPDVLAERLGRGNLRMGVVNAGISGNRVLHDQPQPQFGANALARFDRDVLAVPGVTHVTLLEGINDIGQPGTLGGIQVVTADEIIEGYKQLVARAHAHGLKIIGGTLTPFADTTIPDYFSPAGEEKRQAVNRFIRTSGLFDGVIDFDAALRNPANPSHMLPAFDSGDHLHPNDAGYQAMAEAVDLRLFR